jgi:hypothetical protein
MPLIRLRKKNQLTLPAEFVEELKLGEGALLGATLEQGSIRLREARVAVVGSPEAEDQERQAKEEIRQGRYTTFATPEDFLNAVPDLIAAAAESSRLPDFQAQLQSFREQLDQMEINFKKYAGQAPSSKKQSAAEDKYAR